MALNFFSHVDEDRIRSTFGEQKYRRLVTLKDRYDPHNVFQRNQNVRPSLTDDGSAVPVCLSFAQERR